MLSIWKSRRLLTVSRLAVIVVSVLLLIEQAGAQESEAAVDSPLPGTIEALTSSGEHIWAIVKDPFDPEAQPATTDEEQTKRKYKLCYSGPSMAPATFTQLRSLAELPDRFQAVGTRVYLISDRASPGTGFDVYSMTVAHNQPFDVYFAEPQERMELHAPLPDGELLAVADHNGALMVLMDVAEPRPEDNPGSGDFGAGLHLLQLLPNGWMQLLLPSPIVDTPNVRLATAGAAGKQLMLLHPDSNAPARSVVYVWQTSSDAEAPEEHDDRWARQTMELDAASIRAITRCGGQATIIQQIEGQSTIQIGYLRPSAVIELASMDEPARPWFLIGTEQSLSVVISAAGIGIGAQIITIDPLTGEPGEAQGLRLHRTRGARIWFVALLLAGSVSIALLIVLLRPAPKTAIELPKGVALLPPMQRVVALLIDAFPAAVVTWLLTRCSIAEMFQAPLVTPKLVMSNEYLILIGVTLLHSTISEAVTGTTLGKAMLGARVIAFDGQRPGVGSCLLRAFGKGLTLLVLPIAVFGVINRNHQGVDDLLGQTLVVHEPEDQPAVSNDS